MWRAISGFWWEVPLKEQCPTNLLNTGVCDLPATWQEQFLDGFGSGKGLKGRVCQFWAHGCLEPRQSRELRCQPRYPSIREGAAAAEAEAGEAGEGSNGDESLVAYPSAPCEIQGGEGLCKGLQG